jgi:hypothetical protein
MKPFTVEAADVSAALRKAKAEIEKRGGRFEGDDSAGHYQGNGFAGSFRVRGNTITISIDKKPLLIPEALIRGVVRDFFS